MKLADFEGRWLFRRRVLDAEGRVTARVAGELLFTPGAGGLVADEVGEMHLPGRPPMRTSRRVLWRQPGGPMELSFADGRPFHSFDADNPRPAARHDCAPDLYLVEYDFTAWPAWRSIWRVTGPDKHYMMLTAHARDAAMLAELPLIGQNPEKPWRDDNGA